MPDTPILDGIRLCFLLRRGLKSPSGTVSLNSISEDAEDIEVQPSNAAMYAVTPNEDEIPTATAGGLWGAYLMTFAHFYKELASLRLAINSELSKV